MPDVQPLVDGGHYAREQIHSCDPLIAWSRRQRFRAGHGLARPFAGSRVLDCGCGDGTCLGLLQVWFGARTRVAGVIR